MYPTWAIGLGWSLALSSMMCVPLVMVIRLCQTEGPFLVVSTWGRGWLRGGRGVGAGRGEGEASYRLLAVGLLCDLGHIAALSGSWTPCLPHRGLEIVGRHVGEREQRTVPVDEGSVVTFGAGCGQEEEFAGQRMRPGRP